MGDIGVPRRQVEAPEPVPEREPVEAPAQPAQPKEPVPA